MNKTRKKAQTRRIVKTKCVHCLIILKEPFQKIFDDSGKELELEELLRKCFNLNLEKSATKEVGICNDCLEKLIETYDLLEKETLEKSNLKELSSSHSENHEKPEKSHKRQKRTLKVEKCEEELIRESKSKRKKIEESSLSPNQVIIELKTKNEEDSCEDEFENVDYLETCDEVRDFREYKRHIIESNFQDISFSSIECMICNEKLNKHVDVIEHTRTKHCVEDFAYPCIIDSTCELLRSIDNLSLHLVFEHYDIESLKIYCTCPECNIRFSDFISFNKHSCYTGKDLSRSQTECEKCGKHFSSNKRYRFHQQFHLEKYRPKACFICDTNIDNENNLYEHLMYGHEKNVELICISCDRVFQNEENLRKHQTVHKLKRPYVCKVCKRSYLYSQLLREHMILHHSENAFQCPICGKCLTKKAILKKHIEGHEQPSPTNTSTCKLCGLILEDESMRETHIEHHIDSKEIRKGEDVAEIETISMAYCCEYCENAFNTIENLNVHRSLHEDSRFYCNMCPLIYDEYKKLKIHKLTHINYVDEKSSFPVSRYYVCDVEGCSNYYLQWSTLRSHKKSKHPEDEIHICPRCSEVFTKHSALRAHINEVHKEGAYDCQFCDKTFKTKMAVAVHVGRRHNKNRFHCNFCSTSFKSEDQLQSHNDIMHINLTCKDCNKVMKNLKTLQHHIKVIHEKELRYFCQYCEKGFYNRCDKNKHEQSVHKKIKKYQCNVCPYTAIYKDSLVLHQRAHNNENPYICDICGKGFRRRYTLVLHTRRHNNIRDFICPYDCGASYPNKGVLNAHVRSKHSRDNLEDENIDNQINKRTRRKQELRVISPSVEYIVNDDDGLVADEERKQFKNPLDEENENSSIENNAGDHDHNDHDSDEYASAEIDEPEAEYLIFDEEDEYEQDLKEETSEQRIDHDYIVIQNKNVEFTME